MGGPQPQIRKFAVIFCTSATANDFYFRELEPQTLLLFFSGLINRKKTYSSATMLHIFHEGYRPVINTSKFSLIYLIPCFCKLQHRCQQHGLVKMYAGLFKQNCERNSSMVAGMETWKRVTSPTSHFRRSF